MNNKRRLTLVRIMCLVGGGLYLIQVVTMDKGIFEAFCACTIVGVGMYIAGYEDGIE